MIFKKSGSFDLDGNHILFAQILFIRRKLYMTEFTNMLRRMLEEILLFIPGILKAALLLLVTWVIAVLVRKLVEKALLQFKVDQHLAKGRQPLDPAYGTARVKDIAKIAYFLVVLVFLPSIFEALGMSAISQPISNMVGSLFAFIPNLLGAGVILFIGYFVAKLLRDLTYTFLRSVNIDKWFNKVSPNRTDDALNLETKDTLANVLSKVVLGVVLIPVITSALEVLNIQSLSQPIVAVLNQVLMMVPNIFVAVLLVVAGYYIASFVAQLLEDLLRGMGINKIFSFMDTDKATRFDLAKILAGTVKVLIVLFITVEALTILHLDVLNTIGAALIGYLPLVLSGLLILAAGILGGILTEGLINKYAKSPYSAAIAKYIIIIFSVFMTLEQIKFASTIVNIAFLLVLGGLSVAFALAFGLGGRDFADRQLKRFEDKVEKENSKPVPANNPLDKVKEGFNEPTNDKLTDTTNPGFNDKPTL